MSDSAHSIIPPSSAARRVQCPRSTTLEAEFPEAEDGVEAAEGTAAHWALAEALQGNVTAEGQVAPNGIVLTEEMLDGADVGNEYIRRVLAQYGLEPRHGQIEKRVQIPRVHPQSWGTPDFWAWLPGWTLFLVDFKFGHRLVDVHENMQLVEYVAGASDLRPKPETGGPHDTQINVIAAIIQPRSFHRDGPVREWRTNLADMRALVNIASNAAHEALGPDPRAKVGPECRDCRGRHACPQLQASGYEAMASARSVTPLVMPPAAAALELRLVRRAIADLEARQSGLEQQVMTTLQHGTPVPGWRLEHGYGRASWSVDDAGVIATGAALGLDLAKPPKAITPPQARKAGLDPGVIEALTHRPRAAATLVEDDGSFARRVFG